MSQEFTDYEVLVKKVYKQLLEQEGFKNIDVKHDVNIKGKSGAMHQIDVFWYIEVTGIKQTFCIECKYWKSTVKKTHIASFATILDDIGNSRGFFVTTQGFQKGAKQLAKDKGIKIITVNEVIEKEPAFLQISMPSHSNVETLFDKGLDQSKRTILQNWIAKLSQKPETTGETEVYDSEKKLVCLFSDLVRDDHTEDGHYKIEFDNMFVHIDDIAIRVVAIEYDFHVNHLKQFDLEGYSEIAKIIVKDILEDTKKTMKLKS